MKSKDRFKVIRPMQEDGAIRFGSFSGPFGGNCSYLFDMARLKGESLDVVGQELARIVWDVFFFLGKEKRKFDVFLAVGRSGALLAEAMSTALSRRCPQKIPVLCSGRALSRLAAGTRVLIIGDRLQEETVSVINEVLQRKGKLEGLVLLFDVADAKERSRIPVINGAEPGHGFLIQGVISRRDTKTYLCMKNERDLQTAARRRA